MTGLDFEGVKRAHSLVSAAQGVGVKLRRAGREWKACCPFHPDKSPSFTIYDGGRRFRCFGCGAAGDVLDFVQRAHSVGVREAVSMLGGAMPVVAAPVSTEPRENERDTVAEAAAIWAATSPIDGTPAERYLRFRRINAPLPASLRFARLRYGCSGPTHPCLISLVVNVDGSPSGIQRTYLDDSGAKAKLPKVKLSLGKVRYRSSVGCRSCSPIIARLRWCKRGKLKSKRSIYPTETT